MRNEFGYFKNIEKDFLNSLPYREFEGTIHIIDSKKKYEQIIDRFDTLSILGFDTETKPNFRKGRSNKLSLIQFATSNEAFLFRINKTGFKDSLKKIFESEKVIKIGVALKDDLSSLNKISSFKPLNFIDLQKFVKQFGIEDNGLKKLVANILGFKISKQQQTSNWESLVLSDAQAIYAATDAWVCYEIYTMLIKNVNE